LTAASCQWNNVLGLKRHFSMRALLMYFDRGADDGLSLAWQTGVG
jgi:hypothetical protein